MSDMPDPYGYSPPSPWWANKISGTSGGVKLSLVTDQRSEKPSFWEPRPVNSPATSAVTAPPSLDPAITTTSPTAEANTRSLESIRQVLASRDQYKSHTSTADTDSHSNASSRDTRLHSARQWRDRDAQSIPGTPTSTDHHHPRAQTYVEWRRGRGGRGRGRGRGRGGWYQNQEPDGGHLAHLDARAQEFVPGQLGPGAFAPTLATEGVDLNEYMRAGSRTGTGTETIGSSRVSVFGSRSRSRSHTPSEEAEDRDARFTERERAEAERQWHLQTSWEDEETARVEWMGDAPGAAEEGEAREKIHEWKEGVVAPPEPVEVPLPPSSFEPLYPPGLALPPGLPPLPQTPAKVKAARAVVPGLPFGLLLERAKMIHEGAAVAYPQNIKPPDVPADPSANVHRLCYDRDFLLQFQSVCTGRPFSVPFIAPFWHSILSPYEIRPAPVRTKEKGVQASFADGISPQDYQGERHTADIGVETYQPSINDGDATARMVDVVYNRLVPDDRGRQLSLGGSLSSSGELTFRDTPTRDEQVFEYEVQEAQRERLEARVDYLAAEVKVLRLELARIRKVVG